MNQATTKPTKRPPARQPRIKRATPSLGAPSANQVGRVRAWLYRNAGVLCLAVGWLFAFGIVFIPKTQATATAIVELGLCAASFLGFAVGWIVRNERDKR
ncbi:MAG: hypothetical protein IJ087_00025 [Eggerthellaceae bacterium]|nr:hypothetical protein [Eggerthellaceae bacterium]